MTGFKKIKNIGFISTRLQGTDGVSLETGKWVEIFKKLGYENFFLAGLSDWDREYLMVDPLFYFDHPVIKDLNDECFSSFVRERELTRKIHYYREKLKNTLYQFVEKFDIDLIIPENVLAIPMNIPLGLAITEFIAETQIPTIAHHHDFYWERERFIVNCINDYIEMSFPPSVPHIHHVVINSQADKDVSYRRGLSPIVIPNVFNFSKPAPGIDDFNKDVRKDLGLKDDDIMFLQPTRVVARKGIEHAIEVVNRLENDKIKLVITHQVKDEGKSYLKRIKSYAKLMGVNLIIKPELFGEKRGISDDGTKIYNLWDVYPHCDFVTYPSTYEGFGNAFLEAIYFKKPIMVNRYSIYQRDIEPLGFDVVTMDTYVNSKVIKKIKKVLEDNERKKAMVDKNYELALKFFSYEVLERSLKTLLMMIEGV